MEDEGFLKRWSRRKLESRQGVEPSHSAAPEPLPDLLPEEAVAPRQPLDAPAQACEPAPELIDAGPATDAPRLPTLDDVAALTPESDFSSFVGRGVEQAVRRSALKKLFADPHFNTMDGLDIYIDDYTKPSPLSETMLASLRHAARLFERAADAAAEAETEAQPGAAPADAIDDLAGPRAGPEADKPAPPRQHPPETETR